MAKVIGKGRYATDTYPSKREGGGAVGAGQSVLYWGIDAVAQEGAPFLLTPFGGFDAAPTNGGMVPPMPGTLDRLTVFYNDPAAGGNGVTVFNVLKNGAPTGVTVSMGATDVVEQDLVNSVGFNGTTDVLSLEAETTGVFSGGTPPADVAVTARFIPS